MTAHIARQSKAFGGARRVDMSLAITVFASVCVLLIAPPGTADARPRDSGPRMERPPSNETKPGTRDATAPEAPAARGGNSLEPASGTFSVAAYDSFTGEFGVAVESRAFNVGATVGWAEAGAGAIATQALANRSFGPRGIELLRMGLSAPAVLEELLAADEGRESRQLAVVDRQGRTAVHTGTSCREWAGHLTGPGYSVQGNLLTGPEVVEGMARAMEETEGELADRLMAALEAAQAAGGDRRGKQSAAILVVRPSKTHPEYNYRYLDLQVEDHPEPIEELRRVYRMAQGSWLVMGHLEYADRYEEEGDSEAAMRERRQVGRILREALARGVREAGLLNNLAWSLATHDLFLDEAEEAAELAAEQEPEDSNILDTLAEVYYRQGKAKKAIEVEERALALDPGSEYLQGQLRRFREGE